MMNKLLLTILLASTFFIAPSAKACSVGGTVTGGKTLCSGSTSGLLTLNGYTGTIVRWESSLSPYTSWTPITNTVATYTSGSLTQTTAFRAVVKNGACAEANSDSTVMTIVTTPVKGTITGHSTGCTTLSVDDSLFLSGKTGNVLRWEHAPFPFTSWSNVGYTPITSDTAIVFAYSFMGSPGKHAFRSVLACVDTVNTDSFIMNYKETDPSGATTWMGRSTQWGDVNNWCGGIPGSSLDVIIPGDVELYPEVSGTYAQTYNFRIDSNARFTLLDGGSIDMHGVLNNHANATINLAPTSTFNYANPYSAQSIHPELNYGCLKVALNTIGAIKTLTGNTTAKIVWLSGTNGMYIHNYSLTVDSFITGSGWINMSTLPANTNSRVTIKNVGMAPARPTAIFRMWDCNSCDPIDVTITNTGTVDDFTVGVSGPSSTSYNGETPTGPSIPSHASTYAWFIKEEVAGGSNATISITHPIFGWAGTGTVTGNKALSRWTGTAWERSAFNTSGFANTVTNSGIIAFGPFIVIDEASPLPVEFLSLHAAISKNDVLVNWQTASEVNNDRFEVERSPDNKTFGKITTVKGAGNSNKLLLYSFTDKDAVALVKKSQVVYYRIKQIDFDGKYSYSNSIAVTPENALQFEITGIVPNPVAGSAKLSYTSSSVQPIIIRVFDALGKMVHEQAEQATAGLNTADLGVFEKLGKGIYIVSISDGNITRNMKLIRE